MNATLTLVQDWYSDLIRFGYSHMQDLWLIHLDAAPQMQIPNKSLIGFKESISVTII